MRIHLLFILLLYNSGLSAQKIFISVLNSQQIWNFTSLKLNEELSQNLKSENYYLLPRQLRMGYSLNIRKGIGIDIQMHHSSSSVRLISYDFLNSDVISSVIKTRFAGLGLSSRIKLSGSNNYSLSGILGANIKTAIFSKKNDPYLGYSPNNGQDPDPEKQTFTYSATHPFPLKFNVSAGLIFERAISKRTSITISALYEHTFNDYFSFEWYWNYGKDQFAKGRLALSECVFGLGLSYSLSEYSGKANKNQPTPALR